MSRKARKQNSENLKTKMLDKRVRVEKSPVGDERVEYTYAFEQDSAIHSLSAGT